MFLLRAHLRDLHHTTRLPGHTRKSSWDMTAEKAVSHRAALFLKLHTDSSLATNTSDPDSSMSYSDSSIYSPATPMSSFGPDPDRRLDFADFDALVVLVP